VEDLRTVPIDRIDRAMLDAFLAEQHEESVWCDYKRDLSGSLAKCVAAMANTQGGTVLVGVDEDKGRPSSCPGVEGKLHKLRETVESILHDSIRPTVMVEVGGVDLGGDRAALVLRVPASVAAPHALRDGSIYIRTGQHSRPEKPAELGWLEYLFSRRRAPEQYRERLDLECRKVLDEYQKLVTQGGVTTAQRLIFRVSSPYPAGRLCPDQEIPEKVAPVLGSWPVPYAGGSLLRTRSTSQWQGHDFFSVIRVHASGYVFFGERLFLRAPGSGEGVPPMTLLVHLTRAWMQACGCLWLTNYRGVVNLRVELDGVRGVQLQQVQTGRPQDAPSVSDNVSWSHDGLLVQDAITPELAAPVHSAMFLDLIWSLGYSDTRFDTKKALKDLREAFKLFLGSVSPVIQQAFDNR
jgi:hypothetical protein